MFLAREVMLSLNLFSEEEVKSRIRTEKTTSSKGVISFNLFFLNARIMSKKVETRIVKNNGTS
jgi:hypothetical protein